MPVPPTGKNRVPPERAAESLVRAWRAEGVKLNPPAGSEEIRKLEAVLVVPVPDDVASFYSLANGMIDYEMDNYLVSFWSIDRIFEEMRTGSTNQIWFADHLIFSWGYFYQPTKAVFTIGTDVLPELALPSFRAFLDLYVNEPEQLGLWDMKSKR